MNQFLHYLFLPHESNQFRAQSLHSSFLINYILALFLPFVIFLAALAAKPGILGITANFVPSQIIAKTNEARAVQGIQPLSENSKLAAAAQKKAEDMVAKGYWAHYAPDGKTPWDFVREAGYNFAAAGENLARDFDNVDSMTAAWVNSPSHADNLLSSNFTEIGIGAATGVIAGKSTTVVVQMFGKPAVIPVALTPPKPAKVTTVLEAPPKESGQQAAQALKEKEVINVAALAKPATFNYFISTKIISLAIIGLISFLFLVDITFVRFAKITRTGGGHPMFHLIALLLILFAVWYSNSGLIL